MELRRRTPLILSSEVPTLRKSRRVGQPQLLWCRQKSKVSALELMSENVSWPKASEGGRVVGKEEIRSYWTRQWKEFDPHVEPLEVVDQEGGITKVKVHQLVKSLGGDVLSDSEVWHVYTIANGLIERMDLKESETGLNGHPSGSSASRINREKRLVINCGRSRIVRFGVSLAGTVSFRTLLLAHPPHILGTFVCLRPGTSRRRPAPLQSFRRDFYDDDGDGPASG